MEKDKYLFLISIADTNNLESEYEDDLSKPVYNQFVGENLKEVEKYLKKYFNLFNDGLIPQILEIFKNGLPLDSIKIESSDIKPLENFYKKIKEKEE